MCRLSWNLGACTSWNPLGLSRPVMELSYVTLPLPLPFCEQNESWNRRLWKPERSDVDEELLKWFKEEKIDSIVKPTWCTFYSVYLELRASSCFEHYLLSFRRRCTNDTWYIAWVLCQLAAPGLVQPADITINKLSKKCITLVLLCWYTTMHGQQNIKKSDTVPVSGPLFITAFVISDY
jgi:hypothetical protein